MLKTMHHIMIVVLCAATAASGCATSGSTRIAPASVGPPGNVTRSVLAEFARNLPPGTLVRVDRAHGHSLRGNLMKVTDESIFVQPKTRVAEPIAEIPLDSVLRVMPEPPGGNSVGRAIGAGAAAGAGAAVAIFLIILAAFAD